MSLIHDALKEMEAPAADGAPAAVPVSSMAHGGLKLGTGSLGGALAGVVIGVGVAAIGVAIWQVHAVSQPVVAVNPGPVAGLPQPLNAAVAPQTYPPVTGTESVVPDAGLQGQDSTAGAARHAPPKVRHHLARHPVAAAVPEPKPAEPSEAELFRAFETALAAHDLSRARTLLGRLDAAMPPNSVTPMRAHAWLDVQSGQPEQAIQLYTQILHRLPNDENASVNLAALENQSGHPDKARQILNDLLMHNPDSVRANSMLRTLQEGDR